MIRIVLVVTPPSVLKMTQGRMVRLYRKCCLSINGECATPVYVLFDTGADPISFVNRKVAACTGKVSDPESLLFYVGVDTPGRLTP